MNQLFDSSWRLPHTKIVPPEKEKKNTHTHTHGHPTKKRGPNRLTSVLQSKIKVHKRCLPNDIQKTNENGRAKQILPNKGYHIDTDKIRDTCRGQIKTYPKSSERLKTNTPEGKT